jgi:hypothetical protein
MRRLHRPIELHAPFPTYKIDYLIQHRHEQTKSPSDDKFFLVREGHPWPLGRPPWVFMEIFNKAAYYAESAEPRELEFKTNKEIAQRFFHDVCRFNEAMKTVDAEAVSSIAVPFEAMENPEQEVLFVESEIGHLKAAVEEFMSLVTIPKYRIETGNYDLLTRKYIGYLSRHDGLRPFTPVNEQNWKEFVRLLAAGWEDLGFPRAHGGKTYPTVYGWLSDRVRTQFGFRPKRKGPRNPEHVCDVA